MMLTRVWCVIGFNSTDHLDQIPEGAALIGDAAGPLVGPGPLLSETSRPTSVAGLVLTAALARNPTENAKHCNMKTNDPQPSHRLSIAGDSGGAYSHCAAVEIGEGCCPRLIFWRHPTPDLASRRWPTVVSGSHEVARWRQPRWLYVAGLRRL